MQESGIFRIAVNLPPAERAGYLERVCGQDSELRQSVESLLQAHEQTGDFLQRPALGDLFEGSGKGVEGPGSVVGPFKLLQELGEGGFGVVFMAEQTEPVKRKVALKIIKPGMDSKQVLARFEQERQALARMDHPNIAKILDAGTTESGRPYFVMELVKGVPLTTFCDENRLGTRERLELFTQVCAAIQHAHTKGIIHRDVKPSNVLVALYDGKAVPKVIDFGIAKAIEQSLTEQTLFTRVGQVIGTFEYMSPEQATTNQLDVDTRSDVYALGVLLYELLTGFTPLDKERLRTLALDEMLRAIREEEPPRPSTRLSNSAGGLPLAASYRGTDAQKLTQALRGELDWIALKALEKDRSRRYQSATGLAEDVARFLRDEQVLACPPSWGYRAGKFLRKHRAAFTLGGTAAALLLVEAVVSGGLAWWAINERKIAQQERNSAQQERDKAQEERDTAQRERDAANAARLQARRAHYNLSMNLITMAWQAEDRRQVVQLLDALRPAPGEVDLRNFEWHYWDRQIHPERRSVQVVSMPTSRVLAQSQEIALSGDGSRIAFLDAAKQNPPVLKVVDAATKDVLFSQPITEGTAKCITLNRDGSRLAFTRLMASKNEKGSNLKPAALEVWDVESTSKQPLFARQFTDEALISGLKSYPGGGVPTIELSPDGRRLAFVSWVQKSENQSLVRSYSISVWDLNKPESKPLFSITRELSRTWNGFYVVRRYPLAFNSDGSRLAMISFSEEGTEKERQREWSLEIWDITTGKRRARLPIQARTQINSIAFSPDGGYIAGIGQKYINYPESQTVANVLWEGAGGDSLRLVRETPMKDLPVTANLLYGPPIRRLSFSPDNRLLAIYGGSSVVHLLAVKGGQEVRVVKTLGEIELLAFEGKGERFRAIVATGEPNADRSDWYWYEWDVDGRVRDVDTPHPSRDQQRKVKEEVKEVKEVTLRSRNGERQITYLAARRHGRSEEKENANVIIVRDSAGKEIRRFEEHQKAGRSASIIGVALSPNGNHALSATSSEKLVWNVNTGNILFRQERSNFRGSDVSSDGRLLLARKSGEVKVVNFDDLSEYVHLGKSEDFDNGIRNTIFFTPDSRQVVGSTKGSVKVWEVASGKLTTYDNTTLVESMNRGRYLKTQSNTGEIVLVNLATQETRYKLKGRLPSGDPFAPRLLLFSPDGTMVVHGPVSTGPPQDRKKGIFGGRTQVWDAGTGDLRLVIDSSRLEWLAFSPCGQRLAGFTQRLLASGAVKSEVKVWDCATGAELLTLDVPNDNNPDWKLSFSPDGRTLSASFHDRKPLLQYITRTWDATPRQEPKR